MISLSSTSVLNSLPLPQTLVINGCLDGVQLAVKNLLSRASCGTEWQQLLIFRLFIALTPTSVPAPAVVTSELRPMGKGKCVARC